ncbi:Por secretion system C-terminal sorting domain-containing protein [Hyunsoonleella jejuensis]|uniref:Por secretion system C-terminal sorting domain-containing protein n=1 Tax=Hyunsoonleella jejuensis TaxID=419940 RepID=A0A1H9CDP7_9FLAO|nr:LamG-like jellyroll fold domain-containing protein [Hyunsoonleella jejuensis]SEP99151.1 Por secretion system C-terminal sorting domain-containing protein [Hyunsoonleella jejuensis]
MKLTTTFLNRATCIFAIVLVTTFSAFAQTPVAHFDFNGNLTDSSTNGYTLTPQGTFAAAYEADQESTANSAISFPGTSGDYLLSNYNGITGAAARTVTAWFKSTTTYARNTIVGWGTSGSGAAFNVMLTDVGGIRVEGGSSNKRTSGLGLNDGNWHHVGVTFEDDGTPTLDDVKIFVDGVEITSGLLGFNTATAINTASGAMQIGNAVDNANYYFRNGALNDIRIFDSALTEAQILAISGITAAAPVADFSASNTAPSTDEIISFTDASTNSPTSWSWDFGAVDAIGNTTDPNPQVSYPTAGTYTVTLTATNAGGSDDEIKTSYITVSAGSGTGDLQLQYNFDGDVADASSYGRDLTATGAFVPSYEADADANASSALTASGVYADHLITGYPGVAADGARTVTGWFKTTGTSREPIVSFGNNSSGEMFNVMIDGSTDAGGSGSGLTGVPRVEGGGSSLKTTDTGLNDGNWHHIAVTYDPADGDKLSDCKIYIDGVLSTNSGDTPGSANPGTGISFNSTSTVINTNTSNFLKVGSAVYNSFTFDGAIDDVRIYSRALTAGEVTQVASRQTLSTGSTTALENTIRAYPNPTVDKLTVNIGSKEDFSVAIYNVLGSRVKTNLVSRENGEAVLDFSDYAVGLYYVEVSTDTNRTSLKVVRK